MNTKTASPTGRTTIPAERLESLRRGPRGRLCLPGEPGYGEARVIWNAIINRRPWGKGSRAEGGPR